MSLILSLIDQDFVTVSGGFGKGEQAAFLDEVDRALDGLFERPHHPGNRHQGDAAVAVISHENVHIALRRLFASGKGAEQPGFLDRLCLEKFGNRCCDVMCAHSSHLLNCEGKSNIYLRDGKENPDFSL